MCVRERERERERERVYKQKKEGRFRVRVRVRVRTIVTFLSSGVQGSTPEFGVGCKVWFRVRDCVGVRVWVRVPHKAVVRLPGRLSSQLCLLGSLSSPELSSRLFFPPKKKQYKNEPLFT